MMQHRVSNSSPGETVLSLSKASKWLSGLLLPILAERSTNNVQKVNWLLDLWNNYEKNGEYISNIFFNLAAFILIRQNSI